MSITMGSAAAARFGAAAVDARAGAAGTRIDLERAAQHRPQIAYESNTVVTGLVTSIEHRQPQWSAFHRKDPVTTTTASIVPVHTPCACRARKR